MNITWSCLRYSSSSAERFKSEDLGCELRIIEPKFGEAQETIGIRPLSRNRAEPASVSPDTVKGTINCFGYVRQMAYSEFASETMRSGRLNRLTSPWRLNKYVGSASLLMRRTGRKSFVLTSKMREFKSFNNPARADTDFIKMESVMVLEDAYMLTAIYMRASGF